MGQTRQPAPPATQQESRSDASAPTHARRASKGRPSPRIEGADAAQRLIDRVTGREPPIGKPVDTGYGDLIAAARTAPRTQAKLTVGPAGDRYEQEADRVAAQVVRRLNIPLDAVLGAAPTVQRQPAAGGTPAAPDLDAGVDRARGGGQPIDARVRAPIEDAFGADFSAVRVHADAQADRLSRSIGAVAFTTGRDVFFRQGAYDTGNTAGQALLAHELTHVVQQGGARTRSAEADTLKTRLPSAQRSLDSAAALGQAPAISERSPAGRIHRCSCCKTPVEETTASPEAEVASQQKESAEQEHKVPEARIDTPSIRQEPRQQQTPVSKQVRDLAIMDDYELDNRHFANYTGPSSSSGLRVDWKAHVGAQPQDMVKCFSTVAPVLQKLGLNHKFLITDASTLRFITIYPPQDENEWARIIATLEPLLKQFGPVDATGSDLMPVAKTGKVTMRFGQISALGHKAAATVGVTGTGKKLGNYEIFGGKNVDSDLPLLWSGNPPDLLFFSMTQEAPQRLQAEGGDIYMAVLYNGKIMPDRRREPNAFGAPLPQGVAPFIDV